MIRITGTGVSGDDDFTVTGFVTLVAGAGTGIRKVDLIDRFDFTVLMAVFECPDEAEVRLDRIERDRLPFRVRAVDCQGGEFQLPDPVWGNAAVPGEHRFPLPASALRCVDNSACIDAEVAAQRSRNRLSERCSNARALREEVHSLRKQATEYLIACAIAVAAAIAASLIPIFGQGLAFAIAVAAIVLLGLSIRHFQLASEAEGRLRAAEDAVASERRVFAAAVEDVMRTCSRDCRTVDLNEPAC